MLGSGCWLSMTWDRGKLVIWESAVSILWQRVIELTVDIWSCVGKLIKFYIFPSICEFYKHLIYILIKPQSEIKRTQPFILQMCPSRGRALMYFQADAEVPLWVPSSAEWWYPLWCLFLLFIIRRKLCVLGIPLMAAELWFPTDLGALQVADEKAITWYKYFFWPISKALEVVMACPGMISLRFSGVVLFTLFHAWRNLPCVYLQMDRRTCGAFMVVSIVFSLVDALWKGLPEVTGSAVLLGVCTLEPLLRLGGDGIWVQWH